MPAGLFGGFSAEGLSASDRAHGKTLRWAAYLRRSSRGGAVELKRNVKRHEKSSETQISKRKSDTMVNNKESEESTECGFDRWSSTDERETAIIN